MSLNIKPTDATLGASVTGVQLESLSDQRWREVEAVFH